MSKTKRTRTKEYALKKIHKIMPQKKLSWPSLFLVIQLIFLINFLCFIALLCLKIDYSDHDLIKLLKASAFLQFFLSLFILLPIKKNLHSLFAISSIATAPFFLHCIEALRYMPSSAVIGRPLRLKGKQINAELCEGSDWTKGDKPNVKSLDKPTLKALETLWLGDAKAEHASVPAFARISWILTAFGAPAELLQWSHEAALEEIEHARICFALASGYGNHSHSVKPMPKLLDGGLDLKGDPLEVFTKETIIDGCQMEGFFSDLAAKASTECQDPAVRKVQKQIAMEEQSHAELAWATLDWLIKRDAVTTLPLVQKAYNDLEKHTRPKPYGWSKRDLIQQADKAQLISHGRLPDEIWAELWDTRIAKTKERLLKVLTVKEAAHCA